VTCPNVTLLDDPNAAPPPLLNWAELLTKLAVSLEENEADNGPIDADKEDWLPLNAETLPLRVTSDPLTVEIVAANDAEYVWAFVENEAVPLKLPVNDPENDPVPPVTGPPPPPFNAKEAVWA
jgi:hypothetical protein